MHNYLVPSEERVFQVLQERIESGHYRPGMRLPTERSLATELGVGRAAVRLALQFLADRNLIVRRVGSRPCVAEQTKPSASDSAPGQAPVAMQTICAILPQHPAYPAALGLLSGIQTVLRQKEAPHRLVVFDTQSSIADRFVPLERDALEAVGREGISGAILWQEGGVETLPEVLRLQERGIPVVFVDRYPVDLPCDFVGIDNRASAQQAVAHLLTLGHRRIAYLTDTEPISSVQERAEGYRQGLLFGGVAPRAEWEFALPTGDLDAGSAVEYFQNLPEPPTALFAMNDMLAHAFIVQTEARGLRVPDDISVIGFDDLERYSPRPALLTTMHQPFDAVGQRAAELLLWRLAHPEISSKPYQHILLSAALISRSTCRRLSASQSLFT